jgi:hypothetical protein
MRGDSFSFVFASDKDLGTRVKMGCMEMGVGRRGGETKYRGKDGDGEGRM